MKKLQVTSYKLQVLTALLILALCKVNYAQAPKDTGKISFSLKQCIDFALQNQYALKNATLDESIAAARVKEVTGMGLPQINASIQFMNNDPLRRMFGVGTGGFNFLTGQFEEDGKVFAAPNIFQLKAGGDAGLSITQLLFSSSYFVGLQAAKTYKDLSAKATQQTKIQVIEAVTKAYYLVLINAERLKLFDKNVARLDSLLLQTMAMNKNGFVEKIDVDRLQVAYNNLVTEKEKFKSLLSLGTILLKFQMSMPLERELMLTEKIGDYKVENASAQKSDPKNRVEYSLLESQRRLQELELKNYRLAFLPTVALFANAGFFSQSPEFNYFTKSNLWYNYGIYGVTLNVPIFDGLQLRQKKIQSKLKLQKMENDLASFALAADLQTKSAEITLRNNLSTLDAQGKNMALAGEVAKVTKVKYKEGIGTNLEVITAETALLEAQTNYYNALYDALISKVDYDKANGTLTK